VQNNRKRVTRGRKRDTRERETHTREREREERKRETAIERVTEERERYFLETCESL